MNLGGEMIPITYISNTLPPIVSEEEQLVIDKFFSEHPELRNDEIPGQIKTHNSEISKYFIGSEEFDPNEPWQQTYSGIRFTTLKPNPDSIVIQDIARGLSMQCRFVGQVQKFYSVAQHSVLVSYFCDASDALDALFHDASEAYICDIPSPIKKTSYFDKYREIESKLQNAICVRFGLQMNEPQSVKNADKLVLGIEARSLLNLRKDWEEKVISQSPLSLKIIPLDQQQAEKEFMRRFYELMHNRA